MSGELKAIIFVREAKELFIPAGVPGFLARGQEEAEKLCVYLANIFDARVHDLENGIFLLVAD